MTRTDRAISLASIVQAFVEKLKAEGFQPDEIYFALEGQQTRMHMDIKDFAKNGRKKMLRLTREQIKSAIDKVEQERKLHDHGRGKVNE